MPFLHATSLSVRGFRGIRRPIDLDFGTRLTIVYGGNATGKSSIAQAMEFALTGQVLDHEDRPIGLSYVANNRESIAGAVTLRLSDGSTSMPLNARTDESRAQIEQRFRTVGSADWPERQHLPVTTTHITSQGALSKVLGAASVTRNDLSGLCAGSYLRFLVNRAQQLARIFRQAATGRNIQTELKDARASYEAARVLHDTLAATRQGGVVPSVDPAVMVSELAAALGTADVTSVAGVLAIVDKRVDKADTTLHAIQALLLRMRDLGQYEVELTQLRSLVADFVAQEEELLAKKTEANRTLKTHEQGALAASTKRARAIEALETYERYQQSLATVASLSARVTEAATGTSRIEKEVKGVRALLQTAIDEQRQKSERVISMRQGQGRIEAQAAAIAGALQVFSEVPAEAIAQADLNIAEVEAVVGRLRKAVNEAAERGRTAREVESTAEHALRQQSERSSLFLSAATELRSFLEDDKCPLCGHSHGNADTLQAAIEATMQAKLSSSTTLRGTFEEASARRREEDQTHSDANGLLVTAEAASIRHGLRSAELKAKQAVLLARINNLLRDAGVTADVTLQSLGALQDTLREQLTNVTSELVPRRTPKTGN